MTVSSIAPSRIAFATTAHSSRSARNFGKIRPLDVAPSSCPALPTRWSPRATDFGLSTWITRSTAPMSMPSSRLEVATRHGMRPALRSSSIRTRCSRAREPWWARATSPSASSLIRSASRSARRRLFTNTIVERCARTSSRRAGYIEGQIDRDVASYPGSISTPSCTTGCDNGRDDAPSSRMSSTGTTTSRSSSFRCPASTSAISRPGPATQRPISASGRWVAERPIRWKGCSTTRSSRSSDSARCAPRFVPATACTSSRITVSTVFRSSRPREVRSRNSDSGVVIRMSGGVRSIRSRSRCGVSPVRTPTDRVERIPASGPRRFRSTS